MIEEQQPRFLGPLTYQTAGRILIDQDNDLLSFDEVIRRVIWFSRRKKSYSGPKLLKVDSKEVNTAITEGIWGYTNVYWTSDSISLKYDRFGLGSQLDEFFKESPGSTSSTLPQHPDRVLRYVPKMFGTFTHQSFLDSPASDLFGENSKGIAELAKKGGIEIDVRGCSVKKDIVRTVCSLSVRHLGIILNLADDENNRCYAFGKRTKEAYDRSRFTQP